jgi:hypothetical protein
MAPDLEGIVSLEVIWLRGGLGIVSHVVLLSFRALDTVGGCSGCFPFFCDEPKVFRTSSHLAGIHCLVRCSNITGENQTQQTIWRGWGRKENPENTQISPAAIKTMEDVVFPVYSKELFREGASEPLPHRSLNVTHQRNHPVIAT